MPFKSQAQRRWMYANDPRMAERWQAHTPKGKSLPARVAKKKAAFGDQGQSVPGWDPALALTRTAVQGVVPELQQATQPPSQQPAVVPPPASNQLRVTPPYAPAVPATGGQLPVTGPRLPQDVLKAAALFERSFESTKNAFVPQPTDWSCYPTAVANACVYAGVEPPPMGSMIKAAACENGATIHENTLLEMSGLRWRKATSSEVMKSAGLLTIMHPRWNLHEVFAFHKKGRVNLVNSGLTGDLVASFDPKDVPLPPHENQQRAWVLGGVKSAFGNHPLPAPPDHTAVVEQHRRDALALLRPQSAAAPPVPLGQSPVTGSAAMSPSMMRGQSPRFSNPMPGSPNPLGAGTLAYGGARAVGVGNVKNARSRKGNTMPRFDKRADDDPGPILGRYKTPVVGGYKNPLLDGTGLFPGPVPPGFPQPQVKVPDWPAGVPRPHPVPPPAPPPVPYRGLIPDPVKPRGEEADLGTEVGNMLNWTRGRLKEQAEDRAPSPLAERFGEPLRRGIDHILGRRQHVGLVPLGDEGQSAVVPRLSDVNKLPSFDKPKPALADRLDALATEEAGTLPGWPRAPLPPATVLPSGPRAPLPPATVEPPAAGRAMLPPATVEPPPSGRAPLPPGGLPKDDSWLARGREFVGNNPGTSAAALAALGLGGYGLYRHFTRDDEEEKDRTRRHHEALKAANFSINHPSFRGTR